MAQKPFCSKIKCDNWFFPSQNIPTSASPLGNDLWFFDERVIRYCDIYEGQCYQWREVLDCELSLISARDINAAKYIHIYSTRFCGCNPSRTLCPRDKRNNHISALTAVITMEGHKSIRRTYLMTTYRSMLYNHYIMIGGKQFWVHNNSTLLRS